MSSCGVCVHPSTPPSLPPLPQSYYQTYFPATLCGMLSWAGCSQAVVNVSSTHSSIEEFRTAHLRQCLHYQCTISKYYIYQTSIGNTYILKKKIFISQMRFYVQTWCGGSHDRCSSKQGESPQYDIGNPFIPHYNQTSARNVENMAMKMNNGND